MFNATRAAAALVVVFSFGLATGPVWAEQESVTDISGTWSGKGFVQADENARKIKVRCKIEGNQDATEAAFDGACRAMLIMKRDIGAQLTWDGTNYTGTYKGADVGVAELSGERTDPNQLVLTMKFPREVNGDAVATMTIDHGEPDAFTITTVDEMTSGVEVITSQIRFERESTVASN